MSRCERCSRRTHGTDWCPGGRCSPHLLTVRLTPPEGVIDWLLIAGVLTLPAIIGMFTL